MMWQVRRGAPAWDGRVWRCERAVVEYAGGRTRERRGRGSQRAVAGRACLQRAGG
jgi:hypothetical protein